MLGEAIIYSHQCNNHKKNYVVLKTLPRILLESTMQ